MNKTILDIPKVREMYDNAVDVIEAAVSNSVPSEELKFVRISLDELKKNNRIYDYKLEYDGNSKELTILLKPIRSAEIIEINFVV